MLYFWRVPVVQDARNQTGPSTHNSALSHICTITETRRNNRNNNTITTDIPSPTVSDTNAIFNNAANVHPTLPIISRYCLGSRRFEVTIKKAPSLLEKKDTPAIPQNAWGRRQSREGGLITGFINNHKRGAPLKITPTNKKMRGGGESTNESSICLHCCKKETSSNKASTNNNASTNNFR